MRTTILAWAALLFAIPAVGNEPAYPPTVVTDETADESLAAAVTQEAAIVSSSDVAYSGSAALSVASGCESMCADECCEQPWHFNFTQTVDYGTDLALPITLTPANTLIAPVGNLGAQNILDPTLIGLLGLEDNLGLLPGPIADNPNQPVFPDDFQFQTTAGLQYRRRLNSDNAISAGYTYYQSLHPKVEQLDLMSHTLSTQYARQLTERTAGTIDYSYTYWLLDGDTFVTQNRIGGGLLFQQNEAWAWGARGDYADANFRIAPFLSSDNYSGKLEGFRYLGREQDYLTFGYGAGYSDAVLRSFGYQVNNVFAGGRWLYGDCDRNELKLTAAYGIYDFFETDPIQVGVARQDKILTFNALVARTLDSGWIVFASYTLLDSDSNVVRQDYTSNLISLGATYAR